MVAEVGYPCTKNLLVYKNTCQKYNRGTGDKNQCVGESSRSIQRRGMEHTGERKAYVSARLPPDPLVSPKCQSGQAQKSLKIGTIRDITLIASVKPIYSSLKKKYLKHRLYFSANRRDNFAVK